MSKSKIQSRYCGKCAANLVWRQDYAEKHEEYNDTVLLYKFDKYNSETGERQLVGWWECPKRSWWNRHDRLPVELLKT